MTLMIIATFVNYKVTAIFDQISIRDSHSGAPFFLPLYLDDNTTDRKITAVRIDDDDDALDCYPSAGNGPPLHPPVPFELPT
jgi:hypothetical protein